MLFYRSANYTFSLVKIATIAGCCTIISFIITGCVADKHYAYSHENEKEELQLRDSMYGHKGSEFLMQYFDTMPPLAEAPGLQKRLERTRATRGILAPLAVNLIGEATNAIKTIIKNEQDKYTTLTSLSKTDLYFYDQPSLDGPLDPAGMQFTGFNLLRTLKDEKGNSTDTAFIAAFELDSSKLREVMNNGTFRLSLKNFRLKYVKPKVALGSAHTMSIEINISFLTSYADEKGNIHDSVSLGKFHCLLQDISIDLQDPNFGKCPKDVVVSGRSFIVPRSAGYFKLENNNAAKIVKGYNQGQYSIIASVKECTKPVFGSKIIAENSTILIDELSNTLSEKIKK